MQKTLSGRRSEFTDVDGARDPAACIDFLDDVERSEGAQNYKRVEITLMELKEGQSVLEVGCGIGDDARQVARLVGPKGRVMGIDKSQHMVDEARKRSVGLEWPVEYRVADAHNVDLPDDVFDCCYADRLFQHLEDPSRALSEMVRVVRPGATIVVSEPDWETLMVDAAEVDLTRRILKFKGDSRANPWMGRQLYGLFKRGGLTDALIKPVTVTFMDWESAEATFRLRAAVTAGRGKGLLSEEEAGRWVRDLEERDGAGRFFCAITMFVAAGRKIAPDQRA